MTKHTLFLPTQPILFPVFMGEPFKIVFTVQFNWAAIVYLKLLLTEAAHYNRLRHSFVSLHRFLLASVHVSLHLFTHFLSLLKKYTQHQVKVSSLCPSVLLLLHSSFNEYSERQINTDRTVVKRRRRWVSVEGQRTEEEQWWVWSRTTVQTNFIVLFVSCGDDGFPTGFILLTASF